MNRSEYQAGPAASAEVESEGDRWTLVLHRDLEHVPEKVWGALTEAGQLHKWAPFDSNRSLNQTGEAILTMEGEAGPMEIPSSIRRADRPEVLEYSWGGDLLRWELERSEVGTRLTLRHTMDDRDWIPKVAAGWHICLDVADRLLADQPIGRIVGDDARQFGWERLRDAYAENLGTTGPG